MSISLLSVQLGDSLLALQYLSHAAVCVPVVDDLVLVIAWCFVESPNIHFKKMYPIVQKPHNYLNLHEIISDTFTFQYQASQNEKHIKR